MERASLLQALEHWMSASRTLDDAIAAALPYGYSDADVEELVTVLGWSAEGVEGARVRSLCRAAGHPEDCPECPVPVLRARVIS